MKNKLLYLIMTIWILSSHMAFALEFRINEIRLSRIKSASSTIYFDKASEIENFKCFIIEKGRDTISNFKCYQFNFNHQYDLYFEYQNKIAKIENIGRFFCKERFHNIYLAIHQPVWDGHFSVFCNGLYQQCSDNIWAVDTLQTVSSSNELYILNGQFASSEITNQIYRSALMKCKEGKKGDIFVNDDLNLLDGIPLKELNVVSMSITNPKQKRAINFFKIMPICIEENGDVSVIFSEYDNNYNRKGYVPKQIKYVFQYDCNSDKYLFSNSVVLVP